MWFMACPWRELARGLSGMESACQCRRHRRRGFDPWIGKIPWRRKGQPIPVFLPGKSHGQLSIGLQRVRYDSVMSMHMEWEEKKKFGWIQNKLTWNTDTQVDMPPLPTSLLPDWFPTHLLLYFSLFTCWRKTLYRSYLPSWWQKISCYYRRQSHQLYSPRS